MGGEKYSRNIPRGALKSWGYQLKDREVIRVPLQWFQLQPIEERRVALDHVGEITVSTVFLGIDHSHTLSGPPVLFETMVFDPDHKAEDLFTQRYTTLEEAEAGHVTIVALVKGGLEPEGASAPHEQSEPPRTSAP